MQPSRMTKLLYTFIFVCWSVEYVTLSTPNIFSNFHCCRNVLEYNCNMPLYNSMPTILNATYETINKLKTGVDECIITTDKHSRPTGGFNCKKSQADTFLDFEFVRFNFTAKYSDETVRHQSLKIHYCALFELPTLKDLRAANGTESSVHLQWKISSNVSSTDWDYHIKAYSARRETVEREMLTSAKDEIGYTFADLEPDTEYQFAVAVRSPISWSTVWLDESQARKMNCSRNAFRQTDDHEWSEPVNVTVKTQPIPSLPGSFTLHDERDDTRSVRVYWAPKRGTLRCEIHVYEGAASMATEPCQNDGEFNYTVSKKRTDFVIKHEGHEGHVYHRQLVVVPEQSSIIERFPSVLVHGGDSSRLYKLFWSIPSVPDELSNFTMFLRRNGSAHYDLVEYRKPSSNSTVYWAEAEDPPLDFAISANTATSSSGLTTPKCIVPYEDGIPRQISVKIADPDDKKVNISAMHCSEVNAVWNIRRYALNVCNLNSSCPDWSQTVQFIDSFSTEGSAISVPELTPNNCYGFYLQTYFKYAKPVIRLVAKLCVPKETSDYTDENLMTDLSTEYSSTKPFTSYLDIFSTQNGSITIVSPKVSTISTEGTVTIIWIALLLIVLAFAGFLFAFLFLRHRNSYRINELKDIAIHTGNQKIMDDCSKL